jgi:hypothetical protein
MRLLIPFRNRCRTNRDFNNLDKVGSQITSTIATSAAALLMIASAGFGTVFAYTQGVHHGPVLAAFAVAMALGLELSKAFAVEATFTCFRTWAIGRGLAMALLGFVAVAYSLTAELSLMATTRGDAAAERTKASDATKDDRAELVRLIAERSAMTFTAATAETVTAARESVAAAERTRTAECGKRGPQCRAREADEAAARAALAKAISDKAATDRAAKVDADAAVVQSRLAKAPPVAAAADPAAAALASYLETFGLTLPAAILSEWLVLIGVVALELGSALSIVLVRSVAGGHKSALSTVAASQAHTKAVDSREPVPPSVPQRPRAGSVRANSAPSRSPRRQSARTRSTGSKDAAATKIVDTLREQGGRAPGGSVRRLGQAIGECKSTTWNALAALIAGGVIERVGSELVLRS